MWTELNLNEPGRQNVCRHPGSRQGMKGPAAACPSLCKKALFWTLGQVRHGGHGGTMSATHLWCGVLSLAGDLQHLVVDEMQFAELNTNMCQVLLKFRLPLLILLTVHTQLKPQAHNTLFMLDWNHRHTTNCSCLSETTGTQQTVHTQLKPQAHNKLFILNWNHRHTTNNVFTQHPQSKRGSEDPQFLFKWNWNSESKSGHLCSSRNCLCQTLIKILTLWQ